MKNLDLTDEFVIKNNSRFKDFLPSTIYLEVNDEEKILIVDVNDKDYTASIVLDKEMSRKIALFLMAFAGVKEFEDGLGEVLAKEITSLDTRLHKIEDALNKPVFIADRF